MSDSIAIYESVRRRFPRLGPMTFEWIGDAELDPPRRLRLRVVFRPHREPEELVVEFDEVNLSDFSPRTVRDEEWLVIRSIREHGWDRERYRVRDDGEDWLDFYCREISVILRAIGD
jgi:hypothetical protein